MCKETPKTDRDWPPFESITKNLDEVNDKLVAYNNRTVITGIALNEEEKADFANHFSEAQDKLRQIEVQLESAMKTIET